MTQIPFNLRVKLFDTKNAEVFLLCINIENNKKVIYLLIRFFLFYG